MNKNELFILCHDVQKSLFWADYIGINPKEIKAVERYADFYYLNPNELTKAITNLKAFNINLLWDKEFMGLSIGDSICAVSSSTYNFIINLK